MNSSFIFSFFTILNTSAQITTVLGVRRTNKRNPNGSDPNGYAAFGRVVNGIEVVRAITQVETITKYGFMEE
jgi:cyclophilin family peptidyl-prolyl cis-trans isomerase